MKQLKIYITLLILLVHATVVLTKTVDDLVDACVSLELIGQSEEDNVPDIPGSVEDCDLEDDDVHVPPKAMGLVSPVSLIVHRPLIHLFSLSARRLIPPPEVAL